MAKLVLQQAEVHEWFDDEPPESKDGALPFDDEAVASLRRSRMAVREDLAYLMHSLPNPDQFPAWADLLALHRDLVKARSIDARVTEGAIYPLADMRMETFEKTQELAQFLGGANDTHYEGRCSRPVVARRIGTPVRGRPAERSGATGATAQLQPRSAGLEAQRKEFVAKAVEVPVDAESSEDFAEAVNRLVAGKGAFALPFEGRSAEDDCCLQVAGAMPNSPDGMEADPGDDGLAGQRTSE